MPSTTTISDRVATGIAALDEALEEGYWSGSTTLIAGPSGAGKTIMGLHFVYAGAALDEPGVYVTLQENRTQLARVIGRFGWSIDDPNVTIMDRSPVDLYVDELVYELLDRIAEVGAQRLVIDSLNDLIVATSDPMRLREFLYSLVQRCARQGVSLMFTYETMELFRITRLSELGMSHISDNVVLLQHFQDGSDMKRALTVLKSTGLDEFDRDPRVQDLGRRHHPRRADQPRSIRPLRLAVRALADVYRSDADVLRHSSTSSCSCAIKSAGDSNARWPRSQRRGVTVTVSP